MGPASRQSRLGRRHIILGLLAAGLLSLIFADISITTRDPAGNLLRIVSGFFPPTFADTQDWFGIVARTIAFALVGVSIAAAIGLCLAPFYSNPIVRGLSIATRSVHELFWALLLINVTGLSVQTGIVAIAVPYSGIFAKVFSEYLDDVDPGPSDVLSGTTTRLSRFLYARLPQAWANLKTYVLYRYECGLRSSAVLGFIGLPTLGFQLDSVFSQGHYSDAAAILIVYYLLIAAIPFWLRWQLLPVYLAGAVAVLHWTDLPPSQPGLIVRFFTEDIVPAPLRDAALGNLETWHAAGAWLAGIMTTQALPGIIATLIVAQMALVLAAAFAITVFPLAMQRIVGRLGMALSHVGLVILRTSPEYMLAYIFVLILGPSMLPAVLALGLHNGAIIAHLLARQGDHMSNSFRLDSPSGVNLYAYELVPRLTTPALALLLYRWEIIVRESAIVGLIGIMTLGFFVDSAIAEFKFDVVVVLLASTIVLTAIIDVVSRKIRRKVLPHSLRMTQHERSLKFYDTRPAATTA